MRFFLDGGRMAAESRNPPSPPFIKVGKSVHYPPFLKGVGGIFETNWLRILLLL